MAKPTPGTRNPQAGQKLSPSEFKELIHLMRQWPTYQQVAAGKLVKHTWWLQERVDKLEAEIRQIKIDAGALHEEPARYWVPPKEVDDGLSPEERRGKRFYEILSTIAPEKIQARMALSGFTVHQAFEIANEYARKNELREIHPRAGSEIPGGNPPDPVPGVRAGGTE